MIQIHHISELYFPIGVFTVDEPEEVLELLLAGRKHLEPNAGQGHATHEVFSPDFPLCKFKNKVYSKMALMEFVIKRMDQASFLL